MLHQYDWYQPKEMCHSMEEFAHWFRYPFANLPHSNTEEQQKYTQRLEDLALEIARVKGHLEELSTQLAQLREDMQHLYRHKPQTTTLSIPKPGTRRTHVPRRRDPLLEKRLLRNNQEER
jgi:hypothetical protein